MRREKELLIRAKARSLVLELWDRRGDLGKPIRDAADLIPIDLEFVVTEILKLHLDEREEIYPETEGFGLPGQYAGYLDREKSVIAVAQRFKLEWRRFTLAHEIGHYELHPEVLHRREHAVMGGERSDKQRPLQEQEADLFAAELLMPSKYLRSLFESIFGGPIDGTRLNEELAFSLSAGTNQHVDPQKLASRPVQYRSLLVAQTNFYRGKHFVAFTDHFGVSKTAMAIQLEDLGLVR